MFPSSPLRKKPDPGWFRARGAVVLRWFLFFVLAGCTTSRKPAIEVPVEATESVRSDRLANRLELSESRDLSGTRLTMGGSAGQLEIESGRRAARARGVRVFLGEPVVAADGHLFVSRTDVESLLLPIFQGTGARGTGPIRTIAVDAGHGGHDCGSVNRKMGLKEKNLTLDVAVRLGAALRRRGYEVIMTRTRDEFVALEERPRRAHGADLFISIHFNATAGKGVSGTETYVLSPAGQVSTGTSLSHSGDLSPVPGNRWDAPSAAFGFMVQDRLLKEFGTVDRGLKHARFAVLRNLPCPGVLVESAFLTNDAEAARLGTEAFRSRLAETLAESVESFARLAGPGLP